VHKLAQLCPVAMGTRLLPLLAAVLTAAAHQCVHDSLPEVAVKSVPSPQQYEHVDER
jgi:hypothetical protein